MASEPAPTPEPESLPPCVKGASPREVLSDDLLRGDRELLIRHGQEVYHLRITRNGRLLLTK